MFRKIEDAKNALPRSGRRDLKMLLSLHFQVESLFHCEGEILEKEWGMIPFMPEKLFSGNSNR
jgi:hypothetical protein